MDKAGVATDARAATYAEWADAKASELGLPREFFDECRDLVEDIDSEAPDRRESPQSRAMHTDRDCWGPCCSGCEYAGQPYKPCGDGCTDWKEALR